MKTKLFTLSLILLGFINLKAALAANTAVMDKGIYLTSTTAEDTKKLDNLIQQAKSVGISTFVVDVDAVTKLYSKNVPSITQNGLKYVARIVVFPGGATTQEMKSTAYLEKRWRQMEYALSLGASAIQLDYIRYPSHGHAASLQNQEDVYKVISYFKEKLKAKNKNVTIQADVFGIISYKPELGIGQDPKVIAKAVDSINPMVYPSHFWPYAIHSATPYVTVNDAIRRFKNELTAYPNVKIHAFIEAHNFRYPKPVNENMKYIQAQIQGVRDAGADGYYFWSAHNQYEDLFAVLKNNKADTMNYDFKTAEMQKLDKKQTRKIKNEKVKNQAADLTKKQNSV